MTLIYAAEKKQILSEMDISKYGDADENFFQKTVRGKIIICGRAAWEKDWEKLRAAQVNMAVILSRQDYDPQDCAGNWGRFHADNASRIMKVLDIAVYYALEKSQTEIFCIGGKQTIEAFAPFASRVLVTKSGNEGGLPWYPPDIKFQMGIHSEKESGLWRGVITVLNSGLLRMDAKRNLPIGLHK